MSLVLEKKFQHSEIALKDRKIEGYASLFDVADQQGDMVKKGAFASSLAQKQSGEIKMLWQHDPCKPVGVWECIEEDEIGLRVEGYLLDQVQAGREALALLQAGAVGGLSIGYRTLLSGKTNNSMRILKSVDLWEISLVTFPMLKDAKVKLKTEDALEDFRLASRELLEALED